MIIDDAHSHHARTTHHAPEPAEMVCDSALDEAATAAIPGGTARRPSRIGGAGSAGRGAPERRRLRRRLPGVGHE